MLDIVPFSDKFDKISIILIFDLISGYVTLTRVESINIYHAIFFNITRRKYFKKYLMKEISRKWFTLSIKVYAKWFNVYHKSINI